MGRARRNAGTFSGHISQLQGGFWLDLPEFIDIPVPGDLLERGHNGPKRPK